MQLTTPIKDSELARIAKKISVQTLRCVAVEYLGLTEVEVKNMEEEHGADKNRFSRDILCSWRNRNPAKNAREVRTFVKANPWNNGKYLPFSVKKGLKVMIAKINYRGIMRSDDCFYRPHLNEGEGNVMTRVCLFTLPRTGYAAGGMPLAFTQEDFLAVEQLGSIHTER